MLTCKGTTWIDVCQNDGNLLASCGYDKIINIFDKRVSKIIKTFRGFFGGLHSGKNINLFKKLTFKLLFLDYVNCVRWSPSGDKLASASEDQTVKLLDFKTGKVLYTRKTSDKSKLPISECMLVIQKTYRPCLFSVFRLDKSETRGPREQELLSRMSARQHNSDNDSVN